MAESSRTIYVGLDVHKDSIAVAYAPEDRAPSRVAGSDRHAAVRHRQTDSEAPVEGRDAGVRPTKAGPCGYWLYRYLTRQGLSCHFVRRP